MKIPDNIKLGVPFIIERGGRKAKWKIIKCPFIDNAYSLVADHRYIDFDYPIRDENNIVNGSTTIEGTYKQACWHT